MLLTPTLLAQLEATVLAQLRCHPQGLSEHRLIGLLRAEDLEPFAGADLADHLSLFRTHFLLFHLLYRLRDRLWEKREAHLVIQPMRLALEPYQTGFQGLTEPDPLRVYYLDVRHLGQTTVEEVDALLDGFWRRLSGREARQKALAVLGLTEPAAYREIKHRYRVLAMAHHPDRGGETRRLQELNHAMAVLERLHSEAKGGPEG